MGDYEGRRDRFDQLAEAASERGRGLARARTVAFAAAASLGLGADLAGGTVGWALAWAGVALFLGFLALVVVHRKARKQERWYRELAAANRMALARRERDWDALPQGGARGPDPTHPYAYDLDILGEASVFRLCSTITTPPGASTLLSWLLGPASPNVIQERQQAVAELSPRIDFRQELYAHGRMSEPPDPASLRRFLDWAEGEPWLSGAPLLRWASWLIPAATGLLILVYARGMVLFPWWLGSLGLGFLVASRHRGEIHGQMDAASGGQGRFARYAALLGHVLGMEAECGMLSSLKDSVRSSPVGAVEELGRLGRIVGWADTRFNGMMHAPLQALLLWDLHVLAAQDRWRRRSGPHVRIWLDALGTVEALCALAALRCDHPDWCFPVIREEGECRMAAQDLGHPLIPHARCVRNDVDVGPPGTFLFVTGSNMSGKSTLLRAAGVNAVLAQAGGPVCAAAMALSPVDVQTSMRTADSLSEGVSQYMAELRRIQGVVEGARAEEDRRVLYLLDEPLQGTNEAERRVAVQTILGHLLRAGAIGAVATHDLQLDRADFLSQAADAVHFLGTVDEGPAGPELSFDFRLRPGPATSTNALALLRAVGLGAEEGSGSIHD